MPMEYIVPSLRISTFIEMDDPDMMNERLAKILELEEDRFTVGFQQQVQEAREKAWHDRHIKRKQMCAVIWVKPVYVRDYRVKIHVYHFSYVCRDDQGNIKGQKVVHRV